MVGSALVPGSCTARWRGASLYSGLHEGFVLLPEFLLRPGFSVWLLYSGCLWETYHRAIALWQGQSTQLTAPLFLVPWVQRKACLLLRGEATLAPEQGWAQPCL